MKKDKFIIYVEDDPDDRMLFKEALESYSRFRLVTLTNGFELLNYLKHRNDQEYPCMIVLDINMPVMNGLEALSILKTNEQMKKIPAVMFSTSAKPDDMAFCRKYGTEIILKPSSFGEIGNIFKKMMRLCETEA